jgi:GH15 family glucan-1,4-alpha-glucosidase
MNKKLAYEKSREILKKCTTEHGFTASVTKKDNYCHVWSRDGIIMGLAALMCPEEELHHAFKLTLLTLSKHQGIYGQIASNIDPIKGFVSYGGPTGRVDATLWFVIGCVQYFKHTQDYAFLENIIPSIKKCIQVLGAWEFNQKGFLYVPPTGDWADEYIQQGYVLYDQLLYLQALKEYVFAEEILGSNAELYKEKISHLKDLIRTNFWIYDIDINNKSIYHKVLFQKGRKFCSVKKEYWMQFFSPFGYGYRFDALGNIFTSLFSVANKAQIKNVDNFISKRFAKGTNYLLPAFHPIIQPIDKEWEELQISFSYTFKNKPYEFHNGGLWPMVTGFYVLDLALRKKKKLAEKYLEGINEANFKTQSEKEDWGFYEFLHGKTHVPMGTKTQGWSAAASIIGYHALKNPEKIFL